MGRVLTARELSTVQLIALRDDVKAKLLAFAVKETGKNAADLVVRDLLPSNDLSFNNEKWCNQTALPSGAWTNDFSKQLPKTKFVAFYGVINHADIPTVLGTKFKLGSTGQTTLDVVMHGRMRAEEVSKALFDPIFYKGEAYIYIEHYQASGSTVAQYAEELELLAFVCEPYGELISGPQKV